MGRRQPTDAELAILQVLWARGPSTVRQVAEVMAEGGRESGYTTILKTLQIMTDKRLVANPYLPRRVFARSDRAADRERAARSRVRWVGRQARDAGAGG